MNVDQMFKLFEQALREDIQICPILQYYHTMTYHYCRESLNVNVAYDFLFIVSGAFFRGHRTPIHPILIQVVPPFLEESNPVNIIQMSGEAAWKWRVYYWLPRRVFYSLQASIMPLGCKLNESVKFPHGPRLLSKAIYCFRHCYLYPRTECIIYYGAVRKFYQ